MAKHHFAVFSILVSAWIAGPQGRLFAAECLDRNIPVPCATVGPQAPRDISMTSGENPVRFNKAPAISQMRLCNIHIHRFAENKIEGTQAAPPPGAGFACRVSDLPAATLDAADSDDDIACESVEILDTIEVHWVYTTCNVQPAPCLTSCFSPSCLNPELRVEARVFYTVPDGFPMTFDWQRHGFDRYPPDARVVEFLGSTTGDKFNGADTCSPYQATWSVGTGCRRLSLESLGHWCEGNVFNEHKPHGVRRLVTNPKLLASIP